MATWDQLQTEAPDLAAGARALWTGQVLMHLATIRPDGSPRVHPVVPLLVAGRVVIAVGHWSPKWQDLRRDPRCVLHGLPGTRDDELVLRGRGREAPGLIAATRQVASHEIHDDDHLVEVDLEQVDLGWWEHVGQPDTYQVRHRWRPGAPAGEVRAGPPRP